MLDHLRDIESLFQNLKIDYSYPGFYDGSAFLELEKIDPSVLELYADYVQCKEYSKEYLKKAKSTILEAANYLHTRIIQENRKGECANASKVLSRMLEREGIWNHIVHGGLRVSVKTTEGVWEVSFVTMRKRTSNPVNVSHMWLYAPPFRVIDLTVSLQDYPQALEKYFPPYIAEEFVEESQIQIRDLMQDELIEEFEKSEGRQPTLNDLANMSPQPGLLERMKKYGVFEISKENVKLKYIANSVDAPTTSLEEMNILCLSGEYPIEIYQSFLLQRQQKLKA